MKATFQYQIMDIVEEIKALNKRIDTYREVEDTFMIDQYVAKKNSLLIELSKLLIDSDVKSSQLFHTVGMIMDKLATFSDSEFQPATYKFNFDDLEAVL